MSWIFGFGNKNPPPANTVPPPPSPPGTGGSDDDKSKGIRPDGFGFDSSGLEKAARAAKELEKSKHAKEAFALIQQQEHTKQLEYQNEIKKYEVGLEQMKVEQIRAQQEERRKTLAEESKQQKARADYQDMLARKRQDDQLAQQSRVQEENLRKQEESIKKQESMKKSTIEYEAELRHRNEMKLLESKLKGKALVERENRDIHLEQLRTRAQEQRETTLQSIKATGAMVGTAFQAFIMDSDKVARTVGALALLAGGIYAAKHGTSLVARVVESRIGKPSLVRDTSRWNVTDLFKHPIKTTKGFFQAKEDALKGIVLQPSLEARLREIAIATRHTKNNKGFYRNVLMCGPPGTGKTMFAKSLAMHSGMDYAIMTGGDVAPMGNSGVTAIHKVFDWAGTSRKGVLLFIDEADAFLRKRSQERISEDMRATLNAFLYRTGEQSKKFMLVLASNQPEQFDWAINDRVDEIVEFPLPTLEERQRLVRHYFDVFVLQPSVSKKQRIRVEDNVDYEELCANIAERTDGLSGREIAKIGVAWQTAAYASQDGVLTVDMIEEKVDNAIEAHRKKEVWRKTGPVGSSEGYLNVSEKDHDSTIPVHEKAAAH